MAKPSRTRPIRTEAPALPGLRERKKAELKRRIADTALELLREREFDEVTIEEIVRRVDVSQPTFYKYYPSKEAILLEHAMSGFGPLLMAAMQRTGSVTERIRGFLQEIAKRMTKDRRLWLALALSNAYNPVRNPELFESLAVSTRVLEAAIAAGQERGEFTREFAPHRLASMLEGILFRLCVEWGANFPRPHALGPSLDEGFELFVRAVRTESTKTRASNNKR